MELTHMLQQMCREVLSNADIKAICKSRGFSTQEAASRAIFENFLLSDIGMAEAMATLKPEETAALHLLKSIDREVDVSFFERVYGPERSQSSYYQSGTFNQRYGDVFKDVQASLVRKGLLLYAEDRNLLNTTTRLERWRFRLPREFERFLPPLLGSPRKLDGPGEQRHDVLRNKLSEVLEGKVRPLAGRAHQYPVMVVGGELHVGKVPFRAVHLREWQQVSWEEAVGGFTAPAAAPSWQPGPLSPITAVTYAFGQLGAGQWILPEVLGIPLRIFCYGGKIPDGRDLCEKGWHWGCLARQNVGIEMYYRMPAVDASTEPEADVDPTRYLDAAPDGSLIVNLETVPYQALEDLSRMASFTVAGRFLAAMPRVSKIGTATEVLRDRPLTRWLRDQVPGFRQAWETVETRWGRQIVHGNLLLARVTDPSLRVQIERALPAAEDLQVLSDEFIAFPPSVLGAIEKVVAKSGYVVKVVQQDDKKSQNPG